MHSPIVVGSLAPLVPPQSRLGIVGHFYDLAKVMATGSLPRILQAQEAFESPGRESPELYAERGEAV